MKFLNLSKEFSIIPFLCAFILISGNVNSQSQTHQGIAGYETQMSTINFMDIPQSDPTQIVNPRNHINPRKKTVHPEGDERGFHRSNMSIDGNHKGLQNDVHVNQIDHVQTVSPSPAITFNGITDNGNYIPPDTHGAVGPTYIMETLNSQVKIMDKTGAQISIVDLDAFWTSLNVGNTCFDPKIVYDPYSNRYIFTTFAGSETASVLMIGATATNDPTGTWHLFKIATYNQGTDWLDYPELGFNKNWIVVNGNLFNHTTGVFDGAEVYAFNKANILAGTNANHTAFGPLPTDFSICPAFTYDANLNNLFMMETVDGSNAGLRIWTLAGAVNSPTLTDIAMNGSIFWADYPNNNGADFGPQLGIVNKIDNNDDRLASVIYRNNSLWFAHHAYLPVAAPTRTSILWWQIDTLGHVQQNALIDDPINGNFYTFPSINVNQANDVLIGYTNMSASIHPSAAYQYRTANDPLNTLESIYTYKPGAGTYYVTNSGPNNRWGDYSAVDIDPSDNQTFWTLQEYVAAANSWGTWWAKIYQCNTPPVDSIIKPITICANGTGIYHAKPVLGAVSYTWTITGAGWSGSSTSDSVTVTAGAGAGTISVVVNNACGTSSSFSINVFPTPPITIAPTITQPAHQCIGTAATYTASTISNATSYIWTISGAGWSGSSTTSSISITGGAGVGTIIVKASNACGTGPGDTIYVTPMAALVATDSIHYTLPVCEGTTITFTADAVTGAISYTWTVTGTGWAGTSTTNSITLTAGSGALTLTVAANSVCGPGAVKTISNIVPQLAYTSNFYCNTYTPNVGSVVTVTYTGNAPSNATYNWTWSGATIITGGNGGQGPHTISFPLAGIKHVRLTVTGANGCTGAQTTDTLTVGTNGIPEVNANLTDVQVFPNPNDGNFNISFNDIKLEKLSIRLVDILGQDLYNEEFNPTSTTFTKTINVGHLSTGIYWLDIWGNESGSSSKIKVLIK